MFKKKVNNCFNDVFIFMCCKTEFLLSGLLCMKKMKIIKNETKMVVILTLKRHFNLLIIAA